MELDVGKWKGSGTRRHWAEAVFGLAGKCRRCEDGRTGSGGRKRYKMTGRAEGLALAGWAVKEQPGSVGAVSGQ